VKAQEGATNWELTLIDRLFDAEEKLGSLSFLVGLKACQFSGTANALHESSVQRRGRFDIETNRSHIFIRTHHHCAEFCAMRDTTPEATGPYRATIGIGKKRAGRGAQFGKQILGQLSSGRKFSAPFRHGPSDHGEFSRPQVALIDPAFGPHDTGPAPVAKKITQPRVQSRFCHLT